MKKTAIILSVLLLTGCATQPHKIAAQSVSPLKYQDYKCSQLISEIERVNNRTTTLYHSLKKTADNDQTQMAVGMILFWPTLFFLEGGDGAEATEYARLQGEAEAIQVMITQKECWLK